MNISIEKIYTDNHVSNKLIPPMQTDAQNPGCSRNGTDLQDPIRNGDVGQVRQRNEFGKSSGGERVTMKSDVIPAARRY